MPLDPNDPRLAGYVSIETVRAEDADYSSRVIRDIQDVRTQEDLCDDEGSPYLQLRIKPDSLILQEKYTNQPAIYWTDFFDFSVLKGALGQNGKTPTFQVTPQLLFQYRYVDDGDSAPWVTLLNLNVFKGKDGDPGIAGNSAYQDWLTLPGNAGKSLTDFLNSLIGQPGTPGEAGAPGAGVSPNVAIDFSKVGAAGIANAADTTAIIALSITARACTVPADLTNRVRMIPVYPPGTNFGALTDKFRVYIGGIPSAGGVLLGTADFTQNPAGTFTRDPGLAADYPIPALFSLTLVNAGGAAVQMSDIAITLILPSLYGDGSDPVLLPGGNGIYPTLASLAPLSAVAGDVYCVSGALAVGDNDGRPMIVRVLDKAPQPDHALKVQFKNGLWGELITDSVTPYMFGGGPHVTDNNNAFVAMQAYPYAREYRFEQGTYASTSPFFLSPGVDHNGRGAYLPTGIQSGGWPSSTPKTRFRDFIIGNGLQVIGIPSSPCYELYVEGLQTLTSNPCTVSIIGTGSITKSKIRATGGAGYVGGAGGPLQVAPYGGPFHVEDNDVSVVYGPNDTFSWNQAVLVGNSLSPAVQQSRIKNNRISVVGSVPNYTGTVPLGILGVLPDCSGNVLTGGIQGITLTQVGSLKILGPRFYANSITTFTVSSGPCAAINLFGNQAGGIVNPVVSDNAISILDQGHNGQVSAVLGQNLSNLTIGPNAVTGPADLLLYQTLSQSGPVKYSALTTSAASTIPAQ